MSVGTSVVVAQDYGAGRYRDVSRGVHTSLYLSALTSLPVMLALLIICSAFGAVPFVADSARVMREVAREKTLAQYAALCGSSAATLERVARESAEREARRRQEQAKQQQLDQEKRARDAVAQGKPVPPPGKAPAPVWSAEPDYRPVPYSGRCPLPADGGIRSRFGTARAGGLRWNGIVIAAAPGSPVRAVRPGKVAYADYLRGYGYLVIVDHGRGLMSLYGQNDKLHKKAGDSVAGNEVIASVGSDDNSEAAGLYFEIRHRGRPSDPAA